jgi:AraC-like DNA-binding protein
VSEVPMEKQISVEYVEGSAEELVPELSQEYIGKIISKQVGHKHTEHELVIFWTQSVQIFINDTIIRSAGYNVLFAPACLEHYQVNHPTGVYKRFLIQFSEDFLEPELVDQNLKEFFYCSLTQEQMETIQTYIDLMLKSSEMYNHDKWSQKEQKYLLVLLFNEISRCMKNVSDSPVVVNKDQLIYDVCSYIHQHFDEKITLDTLAGIHFTSRATLTKRFRKSMGVSITEYIRQVRIDYATQYLANDYSVNETAEKCGFYDTAYFIKVFRQITGRNPTEYKKA